MADYLYQTSTHPSPLPYPIITISLSDLASKPETNDELFNEVLGKLDPLIGEGYVLVVLATGLGLRSGTEDKGKRRDPGFGWWLSKWRSVPHRSVTSTPTNQH
jgi:hypothetical protein